MKSVPIALVLFFITTCISCTLFADTDPLRTFSPESVAGAKDLARTLSGASWVYHWRGGDFPFRFGPSGKIERQWTNVDWRIISPTEVLLSRPEGGHIIFHFDKSTKTFQCHDWDGSPSTGSIDPGKAGDGTSKQPYFGNKH